MNQAIKYEELMIKAFRKLPPDKQKELLDFADYLEQKNQELTKNRENNFFSLAGIWENREINSEILHNKAWGEENN
ncbi:MAG: DUF2281 domain-containing protein [Cyanobacterium sp.]